MRILSQPRRPCWSHTVSRNNDSLKTRYSRYSLNRLGFTTGWLREADYTKQSCSLPINHQLWCALLSHPSIKSLLSHVNALGGAELELRKIFEGRGRTGSQTPKARNAGGRVKVVLVSHIGSDVGAARCHVTSCLFPNPVLTG